MGWPIYFKDRLEISNLNSTVAICCLWTPKEFIKQLVPSANYAILGQLYTKKGINYILRNILANPFINRIYLVGSDLMDSGGAFLEIMKGVDKEGFLEKEISLEALEDFRKNVQIIDMRGAENLKKLQSEAGSWKVEGRNEARSLKLDKRQWAKPRIFPDPPKIQMTSYPSEIGLFKISRPTIAEAYPAVLKHLLDFGLESEAMIGYVSETSKKMKELLNLSVVISSEDPNTPNIPPPATPSQGSRLPEPSIGGQAACVAGAAKAFPFSQKDLDSYYQGFFNPDRGTEDYSYGERLYNYAHDQIADLKKIYPWMQIPRFQKLFPQGGFDQVAGIIRKLEKFPYDKGAIALLGNVATDVFPQRPPKKIPCLFLVQCQIYNGNLNLTAYFRSNDMYNAWPLNAFALRKLQYDIADKLNSGIGPLITISNMAHIYEHNFSDAQKIVDSCYRPMCEWDPRGNFIVRVEDKKYISVSLYSPDGKVEVRRWKVDGTKEKVARDLCYMIESDLAVSTFGSAMDVARQIERAVCCIKLGIDFTQDKFS